MDTNDVHQNSNIKNNDKAEDTQSHLFVFATCKAGMDENDQERIKRVIYELSKDSPFFKNEQRKAQQTSEKIEKMKNDMKNVSPQRIALLTQKFITEEKNAESQRDLSRAWIHVDMDMFYAAVAERDNPSLKGKPVAVGGMSMISTANYQARKYGIRSAMPGFIAKELCPHLIFVPSDFKAYNVVADQIRSIFEIYDPHYDCISLDEASLDVTDYIEKEYPNGEDKISIASQIAIDIRKQIFEKTQLTASAGVACNRMLAKICSDYHKPNGQKVLKSTRSDIMEFMSQLSVRKLPGIGKVMERILLAVDAPMCSQIVEKLPSLFDTFLTPQSCTWLLYRSLGIADSRRSDVKSSRKGISLERTFSPMSKWEHLDAKLKEICEKLAEQIRDHELEGKTVTLKLKHTSFKAVSRSVTSDKYFKTFDQLYDRCTELLRAEMPMNIRLMGVRLSSLKEKVPSDQKGIKDFFQTSSDPWIEEPVNEVLHRKKPKIVNESLDRWLKPISELEHHSLPKCPICNRIVKENNILLNRHIDECISKNTSSL